MSRSAHPAVRPLESRDFLALERLFENFPYKKDQQRFQSLNERRLARFFTEAEQKHFEQAGGAPSQWIVRENRRLTAFAGLRSDSWHSRFYNMRFGRVAPFLSHAASPAHRARLVETLLKNARAAGLEHLIARIDGSDYSALQALQNAGFYLVDCSVKLSARLDAVAETPPPVSRRDLRIRPFCPEDVEALQRIVAESHPLNHYYNDPHLERSATDRLFQAWVGRCCREMPSDVFVLDREGCPCGFVVYLHPVSFNRAMDARLVILDLVCLDRSTRGGGWGRRLISDTLRILSGSFSLVELRTSQNNYPALSCYADLGMRVISTDFILHRHMEPA